MFIRATRPLLEITMRNSKLLRISDVYSFIKNLRIALDILLGRIELHFRKHPAPTAGMISLEFNGFNLTIILRVQLHVPGNIVSTPSGSVYFWWWKKGVQDLMVSTTSTVMEPKSVDMSRKFIEKPVSIRQTY